MKLSICLISLFFGWHLAAAQSPAEKDSLKKATPLALSGIADDPTRIFIKAEHEPQFPGGDSAWQQFLHDSLVYPRKALRKGIEGRVMVAFTVETNGSLSFLEAPYGDALLKDAALELMRRSPRWIPATQNDYVVRFYKKLFIDFTLPDKK